MSRLLLVITLVVTALATRAEQGLLTATGVGTASPGAFRTMAQGRLMAQRAAQVDGQRQLAESTVEQYEVTSDIVATRIRALVRGAFVLDHQFAEEAGAPVAQVRMAICLDHRHELCSGRMTLREIAADL